MYFFKNKAKDFFIFFEKGGQKLCPIQLRRSLQESKGKSQI
jgi:hypothetical protein